jgi:hypothetical protein
MTVSETIRRELLAIAQSRASVARATNLEPASLCRFVHGKSGLDSGSIDALAEFFQLELKPRRGAPIFKAHKSKR